MYNKFKGKFELGKRIVLILVLVLILVNPGQIRDLNINLPEAYAASLPNSKEVSEKALGPPLENALPKYAHTIRKNAEIYGLDWRLVLAVMKHESNFNTSAVSHRGAYGLMQVMPATGNEVAEKLGLENLRHPSRNIKGGMFYLARLHRLFEGAPELDRLMLSLAAYNAGPARIYDAQELAAYLGDDPHSWLSIEKALPLLSKRYYTLHQSVWDGGKPRSGYFGKSRQTILYVRNVLNTYEHYKNLLN